MQKIFPYLAYLLSNHECVIIPGLGAFVTQDCKGRFVSTGSVFTPPSRLIGFNPELTHNDGLLAGIMMKSRKIDYDEANLLVKQFSEELIATINKQKKLEIPLIGIFRLAENNKLIFTPADTLSSNASMYGFSNFYLPLLQDSETPVILTEKEVELPPAGKKNSITKQIVRVATVAAACFLVFLLLSTPIKNSSAPTQYAGVLAPFVSGKATANTNQAEPVVSNPTTTVPTDTVVSEIPNTNPEIPVSDNPAKTEIKNVSRYYYIIVGSFPSGRLANENLQIVRADNFQQADILTGDGRVRVYVSKFGDKDQAETYLSELRRSSPKYKNAWLLSQRVR